MSLDGRIDDCSPDRLVLSNAADLDRVDEVRAGVDAILVGAGTVRADDPRLAVRAAARRSERVAAGRPPTPIKVTMTAGGDLDPRARFFDDDTEKIVYWVGWGYGGRKRLARRLEGYATVVDLTADPAACPATGVPHPGPIPLTPLLADLRRRGVRRLLVEGGTAVHTAFLTADLADELHLVVAPFFVGDAGAPTFVGPGSFPQDARHPLHLAEVRRIANIVLLRYLRR